MQTNYLGEILTAQQYFRNLPQKVACTCGECFDPEAEKYPQTFTCEMCNRDVPWCFGQDDDYFECCDDCAVRLLQRGRCPCGDKSKFDCNCLIEREVVCLK
jgi:hypothetical protein